MANHDTSIAIAEFPAARPGGGVAHQIAAECAAGIEEAPASRLRAVSILEIVLLTAGSLFFLWYIGPRLISHGLIPLMLAALSAATVYVAYVSPVWIHRDPMAVRGMGSWRGAFIRKDNLRSAAKWFGAIALVGALLLVGAAMAGRPDVLRTLNWRAFWVKFITYFPLVLWQDGLFLGFFMVRFKTIFPVDAAGLGAAEVDARVARNRFLVSACLSGLFCIYHLPNPPMMLISAVFGFVCTWVYYARPNLFAVLWCHAALGTILHRVVELHTRIGPFYWNSDAYILRNLFPFAKRIIGDLF